MKHQLVRNTLSKIEKQIDYPGMIRCHRSYMVNLHHINTARKGFTSLRLELPHKVIDIPVSRRYRDSVLVSIKKLQ